MALGLLLAGCGTHINTQVEKIDVDGTTCVKAQSSRGIAIDCDWGPR